MPEGMTPAVPVFVGRAEEIRTLRAVVERARAGVAGALLVGGDPGVGKTALVRESLEQVGPDVLVLRGSCLPLASMTVPFLALRTALRRLPDDAPPSPQLDDPAPGGAGAPVEFDRWVDVATGTRTVVLVVDDLHWADRSTLDVLMYLLAGPRERRLAVLMTLRRGEVVDGHPLHPWLADVRRLPGFEQLALAPLTRPDTADQVAGLLGRSAHDSLVEEVYARTRGNPYLTKLLVESLDPEEIHLPASLPADLRAALAASWHRLSESAREVTTVLAVGGRRMTGSELAKVMAGAGADLGERLREAVGLGVLDLEEGDGSFWFHHPLQAEVIAGLLPLEDRRAWHERFAAHLEGTVEDGGDRVEDVVALADHHFHAGHHDAAYRWALAAAEATSAAGGTTERLRLLRRALDLHDRAGEATQTRVGLLWRLRSAAAEVAAHARELEAVEELLRVVDEQDAPAVVAELLVRRTHLRFSLGQSFLDPAEAAHAAAVGARAPTSWQYALAVAEQSHAALWADDRTAQARFADCAVELAEAAGHPRALSYACTAKAMVAVVAGDHRAGYAWADRARLAALEAGDFWAYVHAVLWEGNATDCWNSERTVEHGQRRIAEGRAAGCPHPYLAWIGQAVAMGLMTTGRWQEATVVLRQALMAEPGPAVDVQGRLTAARLAALQGRPDEARAHLERADELFANLSGFKAFEFDAARAYALVCAGDPAGAFAAAMKGIDTEGVAPTLCEFLVPLAARAAADLFEEARVEGAGLDEAQERLDALVRRFPPASLDLHHGRVPPDPLPLVVDTGALQPAYSRQLEALAEWYRAEVSRARRSPDEAVQWEAAERALLEATLPWEAAYAAYRAGEAHLRRGRGERSPAAAALRRAVALAARLEARPVLGAVEELARTARIPMEEVGSVPVAEVASEPVAVPGHADVPGHAGMPGLRALTTREREILAHVVAGRTYAEIAAALVVSEKTVSSHLSNMLRKTGAANRVELARLATRSTQLH